MSETTRKHYIAPANLIALTVGGGVCLLFLLVAVFAPMIAPHDPLEQDLMNSILPPLGMSENDPAFLLGTDSLGRDLLARIMKGGQVSLYIGIIAPFIYIILGILIGGISGYLGGKIDSLT